jgi:hypothetical protein
MTIRRKAITLWPNVIAVAGSEIAVGIVVLTIVVDVVLVRRLLNETLPAVAAPRSGSA